MRCPFPTCGDEHPDDLETCPTTWLALPRPNPPEPRRSDTDLAEPDPPKSNRAALEPGAVDARLALRFDDQLVVTVPVGGSVVLGRKAPSPIASVCRGDDNISRTHAELTARGPDDVVVADVKSMNGTYVNGERLTVNAARRLRAGDVVELANNPPLVLTVVLWPEVDPPV